MMAVVLYDPDSISAVLHQESREIRLNGTIQRDFKFNQSGSGTGSIIWPASELLSRYLSAELTTELDRWLFSELDFPGDERTVGGIDDWRRMFWSSKSVLELGAGLGVLANTLLHLGAGNITATDGELSVVKQMEANLKLNFVTDTSKQSQTSACHVLKWGNSSDLLTLPAFLADEEGERGKGVDIIFATDVVFGDRREVWRALGDTLSLACQRRRNSMLSPRRSSSEQVRDEATRDTVVLIAQTRRYPQLEQEFYNILTNELDFQWLFDVDISGTVESMYGSLERGAAERNMGGSSDGNKSANGNDDRTYTVGRTCTSETTLHAYTLSPA